MKARRMGTDSPYIEVDKVQLKDSDILFKAEVMEFQMEDNFDYLSTDIEANAQPKEENRWQGVRERAAIAALQGLCANSELVHKGRSEFTYNISVYKAVEYADALIELLKRKSKE